MPDQEPQDPEGPTKWRKPGRSQVVVGVLLALVGFAAVTQVRTNETDDTYSGLRQQDLIDLLSALAVTRQRTEAEIARLERVRDELRDDTSKRRAALEEAQDQVDNLSILAGQVPVTGPGVRITITEVDGTVELSSLLDTIQELRTAAAEAIQINGSVRVVAQTSFESVEGGFEIDGQLVQQPYVIDVIGEPSLLKEAMTFGFGPKQQLTEDGAETVVEELASLDIEAVREPEDTQYVVPD
jgi:uncharacterized protein YlxW (UPF0749 family)